MPDELKITAKAVHDELVARQIDVEVLDTRPGLLKFHDGSQTRYVQGSLTDRSSPIGRNISDKKWIAAKIADSLGVTQPSSSIYDEHSAPSFLEAHRPIVVKPNDGSHGEGVTINITTSDQLDLAVTVARQASKSGTVLMQQQVTGFDIRVLMIDGKLAASALRTPATVTGDGSSTIEVLIDAENGNPLRGENYLKQLNVIDVAISKEYLGEKYSNYVPMNGEVVQVVGTANIGTGGTATDITDRIPPAVVERSRLLTHELGQDCGGVDFIAADIDDPNTYFFIEVNASPSFGLHLKPTVGEPRQVQKLYVDMLLANVI